MRIIAAAIRTKDGIVHSMSIPARHHHIIHALNSYRADHGESKLLHAEGEQGFLTAQGDFVNRVEAGIMAIAGRQISKLQHPPNLYSEDLW
jgi:cobalamin biosynthesis protein CbiD